MSFAILSALKAVPWTEVMAAAPAIAEGAKKLWGMVSSSKRQDKARHADAGVGELDTSKLSEMGRLSLRVAELETQTTQLHLEMQETAKLVRELAQQNTALVGRVELHRIRLRQLIVVNGVTILILAGVVLAWVARST